MSVSRAKPTDRPPKDVRTDEVELADEVWVARREPGPILKTARAGAAGFIEERGNADCLLNPMSGGTSSGFVAKLVSSS
jgi:hypothetical protein